jgi:hypothetical protein
VPACAGTMARKKADLEGKLAQARELVLLASSGWR